MIFYSANANTDEIAAKNISRVVVITCGSNEYVK